MDTTRCPIHPSWKHIHRLIQFSLVVGDFGVRYVGEERAKHINHTLRKKSPLAKIGMDNYIAVSCYNGITWEETYSSPCQATWRNSSTNISTLNQQLPNIHHSLSLPEGTEKSRNSRASLILHQTHPRRRKNDYNKLSTKSCTTPALLILPSY